MPTGLAPSITCFTLGWIAALTHELTAARLMLDKEYSDPPVDFVLATADTNSYKFGKVGKHFVVIAVLPEYGVASAAETVTRLSASLPHIRMGLLVGIGAAVAPGITLGDIAVSEPSERHGGVIQHDLFKAIVEDGKSVNKLTGFLGRPPRAFLTALKDLKSSHQMMDSKVEEYIEDAFKRKPKLKASFGRPQESIIAQESDTTPRVHYGLIASGNTLIKDAAARDAILHDLAKVDVRPICLEMEAAGIMNAFPCHVIRGICDYADEQKNDLWQNYAALAAAAFAKDLLQHVQRQQVEADPPVGQLLKQLQDNVADIKVDTENLKEMLSAEQFTRLLSWVCPPRCDFSLRYAEKTGERLPGTGIWFLEQDAYKDWCADATSQDMYCHGSPGAGKTMIAACVAEDLFAKTWAKTAVTVLFCDYARAKDHSLASFICSLLRQLLHKHGQDSPFAKRMYLRCQNLQGQHQDLATVASSKLTTMLDQAVAPYDTILLVIDALDECEFVVCQKFIEAIRTITTKTLKLFATSRNTRSISQLFPKSSPLTIKATTEDISIYVRARAAELQNRIPDRPDLIKEVVDKVVGSVDGMFLLAQLYMNNILPNDTPNDVRSTLSTIGSTNAAYDQAYHATMERITSKNAKQSRRALQILMWITFAKVPLSPEQLQHGLATQPGDKRLNLDDILAEVAMFSLCEGLVIVKSTKSHWRSSLAHEVRLVHYTAEQYLQSKGVQWFSTCDLHDPHGIIACKCFTYLSFDEAPTGTTSATLAPSKVSLYRYSILYVGQHASDAGNVGWTSEDSRRGMNNLASIYIKRLGKDGCYYIIENNLVELFHMMKDELGDFNEVDWSGQTPLICAAESGNAEMVKALLDTGKVDVNATDDQNQTPLSIAAVNGDSQVVRLLVAHDGVDVQCLQVRTSQSKARRRIGSYASSGQSALSLTIGSGNGAVVDELLKATGMVWDEINAQGRTLLHLAAWHGHADIVGMLLHSECVQPDAEDKFGCTALFLAAQRGHTLTVEKIASSPIIRIDHRSANNESPLSISARNGHIAVCRTIVIHLTGRESSWLAIVKYALLRSYLWAKLEQVDSIDYGSAMTEDVSAIDVLLEADPSLPEYRENIESRLAEDPTQLSISVRYWFGAFSCQVCKKQRLSRGLSCTRCRPMSASAVSICLDCAHAGHWCYSETHNLEEYNGSEDVPTVLGQISFALVGLEDTRLEAFLTRFRTNRAICMACSKLSLRQGFQCRTCSESGYSLCMNCFELGYWCNNYEHALHEICFPQAMKKQIPERLRFVVADNPKGAAHIALSYYHGDVPCDLCGELSSHGLHCPKCPSLGPQGLFNTDLCIRCIENGHWCQDRKHRLQEYRREASYTQECTWKTSQDYTGRRRSQDDVDGSDQISRNVASRRYSTSAIGDVAWRSWPSANWARPCIQYYDAPQFGRPNQPIEVIDPVEDDLLSEQSFFTCDDCKLDRAHPQDRRPDMGLTCVYCDLGITGLDKIVENKWCRLGQHNCPRVEFDGGSSYYRAEDTSCRLHEYEAGVAELAGSCSSSTRTHSMTDDQVEIISDPVQENHGTQTNLVKIEQQAVDSTPGSAPGNSASAEQDGADLPEAQHESDTDAAKSREKVDPEWESGGAWTDATLLTSHDVGASSPHSHEGSSSALVRPKVENERAQRVHRYPSVPLRDYYYSAPPKRSSSSYRYAYNYGMDYSDLPRYEPYNRGPLARNQYYIYQSYEARPPTYTHRYSRPDSSIYDTASYDEWGIAISEKTQEVMRSAEPSRALSPASSTAVTIYNAYNQSYVAGSTEIASAVAGSSTGYLESEAYPASAQEVAKGQVESRKKQRATQKAEEEGAEADNGADSANEAVNLQAGPSEEDLWGGFFVAKKKKKSSKRNSRSNSKEPRNEYEW